MRRARVVFSPTGPGSQQPLIGNPNHGMNWFSSNHKTYAFEAMSFEEMDSHRNQTLNCAKC